MRRIPRRQRNLVSQQQQRQAQGSSSSDDQHQHQLSEASALPLPSSSSSTPSSHRQLPVHQKQGKKRYRGAVGGTNRYSSGSHSQDSNGEEAFPPLPTPLSQQHSSGSGSGQFMRFENSPGRGGMMEQCDPGTQYSGEKLNNSNCPGVNLNGGPEMQRNGSVRYGNPTARPVAIYGAQGGPNEHGLEKLAVGSGRPGAASMMSRSPEALHNGQQQDALNQQQQGGGGGGGLPGNQQQRTSTSPQDGNGVRTSDEGQASGGMNVGCTSGPPIYVDNMYAKEVKGNFQVWFIPDPDYDLPLDCHQLMQAFMLLRGLNGREQLFEARYQEAFQNRPKTLDTSATNFETPLQSPEEAQADGKCGQGNSNEVMQALDNIAASVENALLSYNGGMGGTGQDDKDQQQWGNGTSQDGSPANGNLNRQFDMQYNQGEQAQGQFINSLAVNQSYCDIEMNTLVSAFRMLDAGIVSDLEPDMVHLGPPQQPQDDRRGQPLHRLSSNARRMQFRNESVLLWRGQLLPKDTDCPRYSEKIFVGGINLNVSKSDLLRGFQRFGAREVAWCTLAGDKVMYGCAYVILDSKRQVEFLLRHCKPWISEVKYWKGEGTWHYDMPFQGRTIQVEVILWDAAQGVYPSDERHRAPENLMCGYSIFLGNIHARFSANDLAIFFRSQGFQDVKLIKLGLDKYEYPAGHAKVTFGTFHSFIRAVQARKFLIETPEFARSLQIEPFIEGTPCDICRGMRANLFCRNERCYKYYCDSCFHFAHLAGPTNFPSHSDHSSDVVTRLKRVKSTVSDNEYFCS